MAQIGQAAGGSEGSEPLGKRPAYALGALAFSTVFAISIPIAAWVYESQRPGVDFVSFWAAARLAISGQASLAYDLNVHGALERTTTALRGLMPFAYPPPFLLFIAPLGLLPYWIAYLPWIVLTAAIYLIAARPFAEARFAFAHPAALVNSIIGQNGLLTSGIFLGGLSLLSRRPLLAGVVFGTLVIKPQLAVLIPIALLAERNWRAIAGAATSAIVLFGLAAAVFGLDSYAAFLAMTKQLGVYVADYHWHWVEQATVFAFFRFFAVDPSFAVAIQALAAVGAAFLTWTAWSRAHPERGAILAACTILVPPYLFGYDSLILILPLARLLGKCEHPWRPAIVWLLLFVPMFGYADLYTGPNTIPVAALLSLWWLWPVSAPREVTPGEEVPNRTA